MKLEYDEYVMNNERTYYFGVLLYQLNRQHVTNTPHECDDRTLALEWSSAEFFDFILITGPARNFRLPSRVQIPAIEASLVVYLSRRGLNLQQTINNKQI